MYNPDCKKGYKKGSLTVEAAIAVPLFIIAIFSIIYIIQIIYVHNTMQTALNQAVMETGQYVYRYMKIDADYKFTETDFKSKNNVHKVHNQIDTLNNAYYTVMNTIKDTDAKLDIKKVKQYKQNIDNLIKTGESVSNLIKTIKEDPAKEFILFSSYLISQSIDNIQGEIQGGLISVVMKKYILNSRYNNNYNETLISYNINKGIRGLDFSKSRFLKDGKSIKIIMRYQIIPKFYLGKLIKVNMENTGYIYPWQDGLPTTVKNTQDEYSVWANMTPINRGKYILKKERAEFIENNPGKDIIQCNSAEFKAGILKDNTSYFKKVVNIRSIDFSSKSYQSENNFINTVTDELKCVKNLKEYKDKNLNRIMFADTNTDRILILVLPETDKNKPYNGIDVLNRKAKKMNVKLVVKYDYGCPKYQMNEADTND